MRRLVFFFFIDNHFSCARMHSIWVNWIASRNIEPWHSLLVLMARKAILSSFDVVANSVKVSTSNCDLVHVFLGLFPEVHVEVELMEADISVSIWDGISAHGEVNWLADLACTTSGVDVTVAQVEACFDVVLGGMSNIFVDPHVTSLIGTDEEGKTPGFVFALSGACDGVGGSCTLDDIPGIDV